MQKIIGLCGIIGSGKDTIGNIFEKEFNYEKISFAKSLKDSLSIIFDWPRAMIDGQTQESREFRNIVDPWWAEKLGIKNFSPRYALQHIGTDIMRNCFNKDIWILSLLRHIIDNPQINFIITDTRFSSEIDAIKKLNGIIYRVKRGEDPEFINYARKGQYYKINAHISEWDWVKREELIDDIITNDNNIDDLTIKIKEMFYDG